MSLPDPSQFTPGYQIDIKFIDELGLPQRIRAFATTLYWVRVDNGAIIIPPPGPEDPPEAPANIVAPAISGATLEGFSLTANVGAWTGNPEPTFTYQWLADDVVIPGASLPIYTLTQDEVGKTIKVRVTATNPSGSVAATSAATLPITDADPPVIPGNTGLPIISGQAIVGATLTANPGVWTGEPAPTFTYQWKDDGADIPAATNPTLLLTLDQLGGIITVVVTGTNTAGNALATSAGTAAVQPAGSPEEGAPENLVAPSISGTPQIGQALAVSQGIWTNSPTLTRQWYADGFTIPSATGTSYVLTENERYKQITCRVTGTNSAGSAVAASNALGLVTGAVAALKRYIRRTVAGTGDGSSWDNAGTLASLNGYISAAGANGQILIRADEGAYSASLLTISNAGPTSQPVIIRGCDVNELPMNAILVGNRSEPWISNGTNTIGPEVFRLQAGAGNLKFRNFEFQRCGNGCFRIGDNIDNLTIEQCKADNVLRFIENTVTGAAATADLTNARIGHCEAHGYSRAFARFRYDCADVLIHDCLGDSEFQDGDNFAAGIPLSDTAHDFIIERVTMMNHLDSKGGDQLDYWNADGFSQENGNFGIQYIDCIAKGNSDGGFDCKGECTLLRCIAEENKKNFRLWGTATLTNCIAKDCFLRGGNSEASQISVHSVDAAVNVVNSAVVDTRPTTTVFLIQDQTATLNVVNTSVQRDPASVLLSNVNNAPVDLDLQSAPTNSTPPSLSGAETPGQVLTCTEGLWSDANATITFQWCRDGLYVDGETNSTYTIEVADTGRVISCRVFAMTANGFVGEAVSNATGAISSVAPANTSLPTINGLRVVGATLTALPGTWTGAPAPTFTYQWLNNDTPIGGAMSQSYVLEAGDEGDVIKIEVTGTNAAGSSIATSAGTDPIAAAIAEVYVMPTAQGTSDGSSFANAIAFSSLSSALDPLTAGAVVYLRADAGSYFTSGSIGVNKGGAAGNPITIKGVDVNLQPMKAHIVGTRTNWVLPADPEQTTSVSSWTDGNTIFSLNAGCDHIRFQNFFFQNVGIPFDADNGAPLDDINIEDIETYNTREGIFTNNAVVTNVTTRRWKATGFSKRIVRVFGDCHDWLIEDFWLNSGRQDRDDFAIGIAINDTAYNVTIRGWIDDGNGNNIGTYPGIIENCHDSSGGYWNGDGITTERDNHDILIENLISRGHTDGGIDSKALTVTMRNVLCHDNKKNFRLWGKTGTVLEKCISRDPFKRGGSSGDAYVHIIGEDSAAGEGLDITVKESTFESLVGDTQGTWSLIDTNIRNVILRELDNTYGPGITNNALPSNCLKLSGTVADVTPPTINNAASVNTFRNFLFEAQLTASEPVSWRISGGADQAKFSIVDSAGVANLVGSKLRMEKTAFTGIDDAYEVIVEAKDANSNVNTKTITITVLDQDPPLTFESFFEGLNGSTAPLTDSAGGKTISLVNGAQLTTTTPLQGTSSLLLGGGNDFASVADHDDWRITGEFSFKAKIRVDAFPTFGTICGQLLGSTNNHSFRWGVTTSGALDFLWSTNGNTVANVRSAIGLIVAGNIYEVAVDKDENNVLRMYIDGAMVVKGTAALAFFNSNASFKIGNADSTNNTGFDGRIDSVQYWKGWAFCASDSGYTP